MSLLNKTVLPGDTIGIIGGGQLGRMMAIEAKHMGYRVAVLDPDSDAPCGEVSDIVITAAYDDQDAIQKLAGLSDVVTYEFENISYTALQWLEKEAYLPQGSELLLVTQDRETEKRFIENSGCKVAAYEIVKTENELREALAALGYPSVLKTCRGGYDGKGQAVLKGVHDIESAKALLKSGKCILEKWVPFEKEISVVAVRSTTGETALFPPAENVHRENILHKSIVPAPIDEELMSKAMEQALKLVSAVELAGTLAIEMFVADGDIYINELAPRPHNSGHYTMDLCETSQFEQHIRAVCGLPLGSTALLQEGVMVNVLGEHYAALKNEISFLSGAKLYLYGKKESRAKRKMGHVNFTRKALQKNEAVYRRIWG
ncbi:5-(carboxyamino)imidazole ribonucleotide synthase [Bacillus lacus]|uniref:N5-carboxyaminoimidazole ribonucleotide synthase n=1 Tax=Metabacillus lacus TaxID=1983721 RepID=A0A7X2LYR9_9BACI|nr:5-(carboxyamino)imidazole ribonucleotide synthase [Metabacillus lacus]MRX72651.1 5-(carboxyamino)imidazole ribonucleotide synthase [Metabacillus lacus]